MNEQERAAMQHALEALRLNNDEWKALADSGDCGHWTAESQDHYKQTNAAIVALEAALAQEQEQKQKLLEAVRVRIMRTAYDCADDGEVEAYNSVKVLCTEVLEMLK